MKRLARAVRQKGSGGRPLPPVFSCLGRAGVHIRKGELTMIAGQPSAGKSLLALWHAVHWTQKHELLGQYFSADSAELGQAARALAMVTHDLSVADAENLLDQEDEWAVSKMKSLDRLVWSFENDISYEAIHEEVMAFIELWGTTPDYIIIDNLTDVEGQSEDEWATQRRVLKGLTQLARVSGSAVIVLHHTSEDPKFQGDPCPPRWAIMGKCNQKPAVILTVAKGGPVACVKNRFGFDDRSGRSAYYLKVNQFNMHFAEPS